MYTYTALMNPRRFPLPNRDLHRLQASTNGNESHLHDLLSFDLDMCSETPRSLNDAKCR